MPHAAQLEDGTLAGSVITMDRAFRMLVGGAGLPVVHAAKVCATTPAERLGLPSQGKIAVGALADLVLVSPALDVVQTWVGGRLVSEH
jgi:N-acetylglucosamine-6-phosphate deacetylase